MSTLTEGQIAQLLRPYLETDKKVPGDLFSKLGVYLDLLMKWNSRTNLTAIREPEEIVTRHFGESLFAAQQLRVRMPQNIFPDAELLDFGSGAGFPGLPIKLAIPDLRVCLAESQGKKAAFLKEAARTLLVDIEVWADRVENMPPDRKFDCVTVRAVDKMPLAILEAQNRLRQKGYLAILGSPEMGEVGPEDREEFLIPQSQNRMLYLYRRK